MHLLDDDVSHQRRSNAATADRANGGPQGNALMRLQRDAGNAAVAQLVEESDPHGLQRVLGSGGAPLDVAVRGEMEGALGADFSDVRVHTGGEADQSAKSLGAHAYTAGSDVVFAEGRFDPASDDGKRTLAHELTHVVQQRSGPVDGEMTDTGVRVSDPSDRFEQAAVASADRVVSGQAPAQSGAPSAQLLADGSVQREEIPEEEEPTMQGDFVQREGEEEEEVPS